VDPYEILSISPDADDDSVRKAYLELVRRFSPDKDPEAFKRISRAFDLVKDEKSRLKYYLFNTDVPADTPFQTFLCHLAYHEKRKPMSYDKLKEYLRKCSKR
jgi:DnaJ-class molecular chaperone